jgi:hypothetical protein
MISGDIVGAGFNISTSEIFFTLNGEHLGKAFDARQHLKRVHSNDVASILQNMHPCVGLGANGQQIKFQFKSDDNNKFRFRLND